MHHHTCAAHICYLESGHETGCLYMHNDGRYEEGPGHTPPLGSVGEPQGHMDAGGHVLLLEAMMNSTGGIECPKLKVGGALEPGISITTC